MLVICYIICATGTHNRMHNIYVGYKFGFNLHFEVISLFSTSFLVDDLLFLFYFSFESDFRFCFGCSK